MTFLLHYYRIMAVSNMRLVYLGVIIIVALWGASQAMMVSLQCIPLQAVWYTNGVINIVSDFTIMILPLPIVWKLNLPPSQKFLLSGIFGLGFFTIGVSILRLQYLTPQPDQTWWNVTAASWSLAELVSAITCACLPTLKPLLVRIKAWVPHLGKGDNTFTFKSRVGKKTQS
ncbi:hypothetical protein FOXG_19626 [Fusarium oxysporum f. sp. lycopersici 4287]|uniref:Rhodopsin domain-containing protein n=1 Tax=Fusarium oxysporum f. sp. lycopersici (strain 4287 / CBS 123668 / FGSC 9935 / NRRL 34936) TaxID=426428 RepID=A0A0J9V4X2_FUSO4|nr:hypothetical protein FOXG_19626 [Fusarium oxysporum f. sp. lycopersici 4287]KAJ9419661.1 hypothetical protein QL093DRAFT_2101662 [Fusarium oxysporum]KNB06290.1 hypothetical protein FOXG_19626 [Fusarium oxysporum f. sp. lycopersici 4287]